MAEDFLPVGDIPTYTKAVVKERTEKSERRECVLPQSYEFMEANRSRAIGLERQYGASQNLILDAR